MCSTPEEKRDHDSGLPSVTSFQFISAESKEFFFYCHKPQPQTGNGQDTAYSIPVMRAFFVPYLIQKRFLLIIENPEGSVQT